MRDNNILKNDKINSDPIPLINLLPDYIQEKNKTSEHISNSDLSESSKPIIWAHIDSWGKVEILQPILKLFAKDGKYTILMTFSSHLPAKHDIPGDCNYIDYLFSLPADTDSNAKSFISYTKPSAAIFATSTYNSNYLYQLKKQNIPAFLLATKITTPSFLLKWYNSSLYKNALKSFTHIFVFDNKSKAFLDKLGVDSNVTASTHPPIDNICPESNGNYHNSIIERFIAGEKFIFIGGNIDTGKDLELVAHLANTNHALKCILAPHTISEEHLNRIKYELSGCTLLYSECDENTNFKDVQILVIDFIDTISHIYRYGSCAYIGGEFTPYLRNTIEATANGLPTAFGTQARHRILPEYLIDLGISQIVKTPDDICKWEKNLESNQPLVHRINSASIQFMGKSVETAYRIYSYINGYL